MTDFEFEELDPLGISGEEQGHQTRIWEDDMEEGISLQQFVHVSVADVVRVPAIDWAEYIGGTDVGPLRVMIGSSEFTLKDRAYIITLASAMNRFGQFVFTGFHDINIANLESVVVEKKEGEITEISIEFFNSSVVLVGPEAEKFSALTGIG